MHTRRQFVERLAARAAGAVVGLEYSRGLLAASPGETPQEGESVFDYARRNGAFDEGQYKRLLGAANEFKEGDEIIGVAAGSEDARRFARLLLQHTLVGDVRAHPPHRDALSDLIDEAVDTGVARQIDDWTFQELKTFLTDRPGGAIQGIMPGLSSDVIGCVVKLMTNQELIAVGAKIFNPLPGSKIGAKGYLGARVQPNSPTDHLDDIRWQVFDAFSYGVGDVLLGTNPVSSDPESVAKIELALKDILVTFGIDALLPHCVLAHVDVQADVEAKYPNSTALWFQSIAGTDEANRTFDITIEKMIRHATGRNGRYGLYFETGQGADFTNGHGHGFDMVLHESRKYGFARTLKQQVARARAQAGMPGQAWVHLNDVAGFIGPEVFRTREQLVRCCLEDIVMGKLHGLCIGLDVCSTLHMEVSLDDLDWCLDQILPACPAYLMALPTKIDPMLGYLTTAFQDHVRLREKFGYKVNDPMWDFFKSLRVIDENGRPTERFGDPTWVYRQYCRKKGDSRSDDQIIEFAKQQIQAVRGRGLFIAEGHGQRHHDLNRGLAEQVRRIYEDGKESIWMELTPDFVESVPNRVPLKTRSADRTDYILHPDSGERLSRSAIMTLEKLRQSHAGRFDVQILVSDGLNAHSIMDEGHLVPFLDRLRAELKREGYATAEENVLVTSGRVRGGYRIGETLFGGAKGSRAILHIIGERPGTGHHTFSTYITSALGSDWAVPDRIDHNITKVVSGIAITALQPTAGADEAVRILKTLV